MLCHFTLKFNQKKNRFHFNLSVQKCAKLDIGIHGSFYNRSFHFLVACSRVCECVCDVHFLLSLLTSIFLLLFQLNYTSNRTTYTQTHRHAWTQRTTDQIEEKRWQRARDREITKERSEGFVNWNGRVCVCECVRVRGVRECLHSWVNLKSIKYIRHNNNQFTGWIAFRVAVYDHTIYVYDIQHKIHSHISYHIRHMTMARVCFVYCIFGSITHWTM